jgi:hypothetical protein
MAHEDGGESLVGVLRRKLATLEAEVWVVMVPWREQHTARCGRAMIASVTDTRGWSVVTEEETSA